MKEVITDNGPHKTFVELSKLESPEDNYLLQISTSYSRETNVEENHKVSVFLTKEELDKLKLFFNSFNE